jgi:hypothetical protein
MPISAETLSDGQEFLSCQMNARGGISKGASAESAGAIAGISALRKMQRSVGL